MSAIEWWRSWHGAPTDPKFLVVADRAGVSPSLACSLAWTLFDHASQQRPRGSIAGFDLEGFAAFHRSPLADCVRAFEAMKALGRPIHDGATLPAWPVRQPEKTDTTAAARQARLRARKKLEATALNVLNECDVTPSHAVTSRVTPSHADREEQERKRKLFSDVAVASAVTPLTIESVISGSTVQRAPERGTHTGLEGEQERPAKGWVGRLVGALR